MAHGKLRQSGWQGASLVAITYVYFLIFAQFAFLKRLAELGVADAHLKAVMAAMATGGILFSLLAPRVNICPSPNLRLRIGLLASAAAAFLSLLPLTLAESIAVSFLIGAGLGLLTVTLVTYLPQWTGSRSPLLLVGFGTGAGYFICNIPAFFAASAEVQSATAGLLCLAGICITLIPSSAQDLEPLIAQRPTASFLRVLACFAALVWLDSAAFFIIQNNADLKAGTWEGAVHLWANALLHLGAAIGSAWILSRRGLTFVLSLAFLSLGFACLLLLYPNRIFVASIFYPIGVSLYSVALVAYPSLLAPAATFAERGRQAGWIYAIAGWCASAMGIGMGQNLGRVPPAFVVLAGVVILAPRAFIVLRWRMRELGLTALVVLLAFVIYRALPSTTGSLQLSQTDRGRQVYISEGCISCHSQYVRPNTADAAMWGPVESMRELRLQQPPLIGNRRQGPDLAEVGARRSSLWLKAHFCNPAEVSGASIMPTFGFLFNDGRGDDGRGDDLVAYLESLHGAGAIDQQMQESLWRPSDASLSEANAQAGDRLFRRYCTTCHSPQGRTRLAWKASFKTLPVDFSADPMRYLPASDSPSQRIARIAEMTKFGIPASDMPGHEYLSDDDIASISLWVSQNIAQPLQNK
jgi:cbb3-type cytochrome oxidase cytochrome c subunit